MTRKPYITEFKAKVALEVSRGVTLAELTAEHGVRHTMMRAEMTIDGMPPSDRATARPASESELENFTPIDNTFVVPFNDPFS
ncbi:hypothetical protein [Sphingobium sp. Ndbn-10]|uniref:hypothetical protein n=1 Tax=Sphingobium sp. Ndbn-10 TaxID=1667223 RepID=UPI000818A467|nr:hypothetical protein [Sphingobium sp. Ndbn-10]